MKRSRLTFIVIPAVAVLCSGCVEPWVHTAVICTLPPTPALWAAVWGDPSYVLSWSTPFVMSGPIAPSRTGNTGSGRAAGPLPGDRVSLDLPYAPPVSILARPVWDDGGPDLSGVETLALCGAVWPLHGSRTDVALTYRRGTLALLLQDATRAGIRTDTLNIARLDAEIESAFSANPWSLDRAGVVDALRADRMRVTAIRPADRSETGLAAPPGPWYGFSPFAAPLATGESIAVPAGTTVWYGAWGGRLVVTCPPDGHAWLEVFD